MKNKKIKFTENYSTISDDVQEYIFGFLDVKEQIFTISSISKYFYSIYSTNQFFEEFMKKNGLEMPIFNNKSRKFSPKEFYGSIFQPMNQTKLNCEKIQKLLPTSCLKKHQIV